MGRSVGRTVRGVYEITRSCEIIVENAVEKYFIRGMVEDDERSRKGGKLWCAMEKEVTCTLRQK